MPGVPAWGAVAIAVGATFLGFVIDAARGTELTSAFACLYLIGVVAAVVLVRYRGLFTAAVQAPLILFVAVPLSYQYFTESPGSGLRDILLNVAIPLVNRFPLMLLGTVLALALAGARVFLTKQASHAPAGAATSFGIDLLLKEGVDMFELGELCGGIKLGWAGGGGEGPAGRQCPTPPVQGTPLPPHVLYICIHVYTSLHIFNIFLDLKLIG